jgi:uncharacterized membrane protein (DUF373 family)
MEKVIKITINVLIIILTIILIYSLVEIVALVMRTIIVRNEILNFLNPTINQENLFISSVQGFVSATLLITILIEIIQSLREYQEKSKINYIQVILEIAIIAIIRHVLILDFEHASTSLLIGISSLIFVLGLFYLILNDRFPKIKRNVRPIK